MHELCDHLKILSNNALHSALRHLCLWAIYGFNPPWRLTLAICSVCCPFIGFTRRVLSLGFKSIFWEGIYTLIPQKALEALN